MPMGPASRYPKPARPPKQGHAFINTYTPLFETAATGTFGTYRHRSRYQRLHQPSTCTMISAVVCGLQGMVSAWEASCGMLDQYGMQYTHAFANLCNIGVSNKQLAEVACFGLKSTQ